jgi:hypothetical protein
VAECLKPIGHKVNAIVNYDRFSILPELVDDYIAMVKGVVERHYHGVTRYTSNTFLRVKLGEALEKGSSRRTCTKPRAKQRPRYRYRTPLANRATRWLESARRVARTSRKPW